MKGQTTLIAIVLIVFVFLAIFMLLFSTAEKISYKKHAQIYSNHLLLSLLKTDTGYTDFPENCKTISSILSCAYFIPSFKCGGQRTCEDSARDLISIYLTKGLENTNFGYYLKYGNKGLGDQKIAAKNTSIRTSTTITRYSSKMDVTLFVGEK